MGPEGLWPNMLRPMVTRFGRIEVWRGTLHELGYPATWISSVSEVRALVAHLNHRKEG